MVEPIAFAKTIFTAVDSMDPAMLRPYLTSDCRFKFANLPEVHGPDALEAASKQFYAMLASITHQIHRCWATDDGHVICSVTVTYRRRDGFELTCPAATIWRVRDRRISEYDIYVDNSRLIAE